MNKLYIYVVVAFLFAGLASAADTAFYKFSDNVNDQTGSFNGITGGVTYSADFPIFNITSITGTAKAGEFDGSEYVKFSSNPYNANTDSYTLVAYIKADSLASNGFVVGNADARIRVRDGDTIQWAYFDGDTTGYLSYDTAVTGTYYHVAVVVDQGVGHTMYINGIQHSNNSKTSSVGAGFVSIGGRTTDNTAFSNYFDGRIDEVHIYDSALNATNISNLFNCNDASISNCASSSSTFFSLTAQNNYTASFLNSFNATVNGTTYGTDNGTIITTINSSLNASFNVSVFGVSNYFNRTYIDYPTNNSLSAFLTPYTLFTAYDIVNGSQIMNFTVSYTGGTADAVNGAAYLPLFNGTYAVDVTNVNNYGISYANQTKSFTASPYLEYGNFSLYKINSLQMNFYDLDNLSLIDFQDVNVTLVGSLQTYTSNTSNGTLLLELLNPDTYEITAMSSGYSPSNVFVTLNNDNATIDMYLDSSSLTNITFNVQSTLGENLQNAVITINQNINGTIVTFAQAQTDAFGQAVIALDNSNTYSISVTKENYSTFQGSFKPLQLTYSITLEPSDSEPYESLFQFAEIDGPNFVYTLSNQTLVITYDTVSGSGSIDYFGMNTTYNSVSYLQNTTTSSGGGTAEFTINPANSTIQNVVTVDYWLKVNGFDTYTGTKTYYLSDANPANSTLAGGLFTDAKEELGIGGKAILATFFVFIAFGLVFALSGNITAAALAGMVVTGLFTWPTVGFFILPIGLITIIILGMVVLGDNI